MLKLGRMVMGFYFLIIYLLLLLGLGLDIDLEFHGIGGVHRASRVGYNFTFGSSLTPFVRI